jgi:DNA-binding MarR family transcriptional regulator
VGLRRRNTVLAALERFRGGGEAPVNLTQVLAFLYVCENEGLSVSELALLMRTTTATASRTLSALAEGDPATCQGLVRSRVNEKHAQGRIVTLTEKGASLREAIDGLIAERIPMSTGRNLRNRSTDK